MQGDEHIVLIADPTRGRGEVADCERAPNRGCGRSMGKSADDVKDPTGSRAEAPVDPLDFILQDHERQLEICNGLEVLVSASEAEPLTECAATLLSFLTEDLALHVCDEEQDLFPMLNSRRPPGSNLGDILDQLVMEHETDQGLADLVIEDLRAIAADSSPEHPIRFEMNVRAFCEMQRRHLNWENRIVIPLAETLLSEADKQKLAQRMAARRRSPAPA